MGALDPPECLVCRHDLLDADEKARLPCGHLHWHAPCIWQWLLERSTCPICRCETGQPTGVAGSDDAEVASAGLLNDIDDRRRLGALHFARERLAMRMADLEEERQSLEVQVRRMERELELFRSQLNHLRIERCMWAQVLNRSGGDPDVAGAGMTEEATAAGTQVGGHQSAAEDLLRRLRDAVMRAPAAGDEVFRQLAAQSSGRLTLDGVGQVLSRFEPMMPAAVLRLAFGKLDIDRSGFVEEDDWMSALCLPRFCRSNR